MTIISGAPPAESPTAEDLDPNAAASADAAGAVDANAAESSNADEPGAKPADLLSVVKDAVKKDDPAASASPSDEGEEEAQPGEAEPKAKTPEEQAEADAKLPFHKHPRWQEVVAERDGYRDDARHFREITGFMQQHGLSGDEVAEGYDIMAKLKSGDPAKLGEVREYFSSRLAFLDDVLGNVLPSDLQARIDAGEIDEAAAKEVARLRAADKLRTAQDEARQTAETANSEREQVVANANACATAVDAWEVQQKQADPDYAKKAGMVETTCRAIVQETGKPPRNPAEAVALVKQAYGRVNDVLKAALPTPKPVARTPVGSSAKTATQPKTLRDAITGAIAAS